MASNQFNTHLVLKKDGSVSRDFRLFGALAAFNKGLCVITTR